MPMHNSMCKIKATNQLGIFHGAAVHTMQWAMRSLAAENSQDDAASQSRDAGDWCNLFQIGKHRCFSAAYVQSTASDRVAVTR